MDFAQLVAEDRRLVILRLLASAPGNSANDSMLHSGLLAIGHVCSRDQVRGDIAWLKEQGLLASEELTGIGSHSPIVTRLTERGFDVQAGRSTVPGVKRPTPHG